MATQITGWSIFWLVVAICFIILSSMWIYGMAYKQTRAEKAMVFPGDDWIKPGEKHLRYVRASPSTCRPSVCGRW